MFGRVPAETELSSSGRTPIQLTFEVIMVDQSNDTNGQQLYQLLRRYDPPKFVKAAGVDEQLGSRPLPTHLYAEPTRQRFPCDTPAATWLSAAFFFDQRKQLPPKLADWTEQRLLGFATAHGIDHEVAELRQKVAVFQAPPDDSGFPGADFALVRRDATGKVVERAYRIHNAVSVKAAADYLKTYRHSFTYPERREIARKILEKAAAYGAAVAEYAEFLERQAGYGASSADEVAELLLNRARLLGRGGGPDQRAVQVQLAKLAQMCLQKPAQLDCDSRTRLAEIVDQFDQTYGLAGNYTDVVPAPEDVLFRATRTGASKLASQLCETAVGTVYPVESFSELRLPELADHMGADFANAITKDGLHVDPELLAEVVRTLPRGDAADFDYYLRSSGASPEFDRGAASGLSESDWSALAAAG